jgi:hypothetical protein
MDGYIIYYISNQIDCNEMIFVRDTFGKKLLFLLFTIIKFYFSRVNLKRLFCLTIKFLFSVDSTCIVNLRFIMLISFSDFIYLDL